MPVEGHIYRTLLVSSSPKATAFLRGLLPAATFQPVEVATGAGDARRLLINTAYDLVIINTPLADEFGAELSTDIVADSGAGVLLLIKSEQFDEITAHLMPYGVLTVPKPVSGQAVWQAVCLLCATRERLLKMERRNRSLQDKMEEIRLVNRAKWALIDTQHFSETEAHRQIERQAMDRRISKRQAAEEILRTYAK